MSRVTNQERYDDICRLSGLSEEVVRRVLSATRDSLVETLKQGRKASLPGVCILQPSINAKIVNGQVQKFVMAKAKVTNGLLKRLEVCEEFENVEEDDVDIEDVLAYQIPALS